LSLDIEVSDRIGGFLDLSLVPLVDAVLNELLLAHHINFLAETRVGGLYIAQLGQGCFKLVLKPLHFGEVLAHLSTRGSVGLEMSLLARKLLHVGLILVLKDEKAPKK
jgi:hypothetical protein